MMMEDDGSRIKDEKRVIKVIQDVAILLNISMMSFLNKKVSHERRWDEWETN